MSARPLAGVKWKTAAIGDGLLSMTSQTFSTYRFCAWANSARIAIGTTAASSALLGVSSATTLSSVPIGIPANRSARTFCQIVLVSGSTFSAHAAPDKASQSATLADRIREVMSGDSVGGSHDFKLLYS